MPKQKKKVIAQKPTSVTELETPEIKNAQRDTEEKTSFEEVNNSNLGSGISGMAMVVSKRRFEEDFPNEEIDPTKEIFYKEDKMVRTAYVVYIFTKTHQYRYYANQLQKKSDYDYRFKVSLINVVERKKTLAQSNESVSTLGDFFESAMNKVGYGGLKKISGYKRVKLRGTNRYLFKKMKPKRS